MSGGCQGGAASQLTLRGGVERKLRAALPDLRDIIHVTDHDAGAKPFYGDAPGVAQGIRSPVAKELGRLGAATQRWLSGFANILKHCLRPIPQSAMVRQHGASSFGSPIRCAR